jgi:phage tail P2-like protein
MSSDRLLPPNATAADLAMEQSTSRLADLPANLVRWMQSPQLIPVQAIPWLAWAFSVDTWDENWTEDQKRQTIAAAYTVQRHKGTIGAVKSALAALGFQATITEWFQDSPTSAPYTFRVHVGVDQGGISQQEFQRALSVVNSSKNLRSHITGLSIDVNTRADTYMGAATGIGFNISILPG